MSVSDLRTAYNAASLPGTRCVAVRLSYCDAQGTPDGPRDRQLIECDLVTGDTATTVRTDPLPPGADVMAAVRALAQKGTG